MSWVLAAESGVRVGIFAGGALKALAHDRTLRAPLAAVDVALPPLDQAAVRCEVAARVAAAAVEPDLSDLNALERGKFMRELRGAKVLDTKRHPGIEFRGVFAGDWRSGVLEGQLMFRGRVLPQTFEVVVSEATPARIAATASWRGRLRDLGVEPVRALLGALTLEDRLTLDVDLVWRNAAAAPA